jgi:hypothetical protein
MRDIDFFAPGEIEILVRCKQFVQNELQAKDRMLERLGRNGKSTKFIKTEIARMEYALGIRDHFPNVKEMLEEDE